MTTATSLIITCGVLCIYPLIIAAIAVFAYRRYQAGGWRAVFFGKGNDA